VSHGRHKMCEGCDLKRPHYGRESEGKKRWCAACGKAKGAVCLSINRRMCEGCGLKQPTFGLASEGKKRWCKDCGAAAGAVTLQQHKPKLCEGCGIKHARYGVMAAGGKTRWCVARMVTQGGQGGRQRSAAPFIGFLPCVPIESA
jgi:hypothetical protein